jgi:hypothetical protein
MQEGFWRSSTKWSKSLKSILRQGISLGFYGRHFRRHPSARATGKDPKNPGNSSEQKSVLAAFFNPLGFDIIDLMPEGQTFTTKYFQDQIISQLQTRH